MLKADRLKVSHLHTIVVVMHKANHVHSIGTKWASFSSEYQSSGG